MLLNFVKRVVVSEVFLLNISRVIPQQNLDFARDQEELREDVLEKFYAKLASAWNLESMRNPPIEPRSSIC